MRSENDSSLPFCRAYGIPGRMALRLDSAVVKGEIDNTLPGAVFVRLWLIGHDAPIECRLSGDAWRDVAGRRIVFHNPNPKARKSAAALSGDHTGLVGDITVSHKVKVFSVPEAERLQACKEGRSAEVPVEWRNVLYLEWFMPQHGRCVIEGPEFRIEASPPVWHMDEATEQAQQMANMQAMRDYLAGIIQRRESNPHDEDDHRTEFSEEEWEQQLRDSDRLADASIEAMEKYGEGPESEAKVAFVMGWDHILEDMADADEEADPSVEESDEKRQRREWREQMNEAAAEVTEEMAGQSWEETRQRHREQAHPLVLLSRDLVVRMLTSLRESGLDDQRGGDGDSPLDRFVSNTMQISGKLAGALPGYPEEARMDDGYILAITKRCLNWANEALLALNEVDADAQYAPHRELFEASRADLFKIREGITDLRRELRG